MNYFPKLVRGGYYHLYTRGNNSEDVFKTDENYRFFLSKWDFYVSPVADTLAYCLLRNHFHFFVRIKQEDVYWSVENSNEKYLLKPISQISHCLNSYAQSFNKMFKRTGSLFEGSVKRKEVLEISYFDRLIVYIHKNPTIHGFVKDYKDYPYSSYQTFISDKKTKLKREEALNFFGGIERFVTSHNEYNKLDNLRQYIELME